MTEPEVVKKPEERRSIGDMAIRTYHRGSNRNTHDRYSLDRRNILNKSQNRKGIRINRSMDKKINQEREEKEIIKMYSPLNKKDKTRIDIDNIPTV